MRLVGPNALIILVVYRCYGRHYIGVLAFQVKVFDLIFRCFGRQLSGYSCICTAFVLAVNIVASNRRMTVFAVRLCPRKLQVKVAFAAGYCLVQIVDGSRRRGKIGNTVADKGCLVVRCTTQVALPLPQRPMESIGVYNRRGNSFRHKALLVQTGDGAARSHRSAFGGGISLAIAIFKACGDTVHSYLITAPFYGAVEEKPVGHFYAFCGGVFLRPCHLIQRSVIAQSKLRFADGGSLNIQIQSAPAIMVIAVGVALVAVPLPLDCAGKALRIVTYGPSLNGLRVPVFPSQASRFSDAVVQTTGVVWCMTAVTVRLMLALSLLLVLVLGAQAGQPLWKLLPLSGYFLLAAVSGVCNTFLESASGLNADSGLLNWVCLIHMDFLYIYLAAELRGKKRWGLAATALLHILLTALRSFAAVPLLTEKVGDWLGFSLLVEAIVLMLFSHEEMQRRISWCLCAVAAFLFLIWGVTRYVGVEVLYPFSNPVTSMLGGYPHAFYALLCNVAGLLCAVQVVVEFVRSMLLRQRQMQMMEISSQTAQEKYEQAQASVRQTASFRHEWKNHIAALHLLAQRQDQTELRNYLDRLDGELEQLSPRNFTANPTVNTIFQRFAAQAKKKDVTFRVSAVLPEMLQIREDDLCSLLFNMLDNALEAAAQTEQGEILCSMQIRRQYLAIRCENTYSGTLRTDKNDASDHGFGLMKMRAIAKKYGSVLDISYDENRFTVMTALKLLPEKKNQ